MTCGEVAVALRVKLAIPFVVRDARWLSLSRVKQERRVLPYYGTEVSQADYRPPPAHYFGVPCRAAKDAEDFRHALDWAFALNGPCVIEAFIDPESYSATVFD